MKGINNLTGLKSATTSLGLAASVTLALCIGGAVLNPNAANADTTTGTSYVTQEDGTIAFAVGNTDLNNAAFSVSLFASVDGNSGMTVETIRVATRTTTSIGISSVNEDKLEGLITVLGINAPSHNVLQLTALAIGDTETITPQVFKDGVLTALNDLSFQLDEGQMATLENWTITEIGVYTTANLINNGANGGTVDLAFNNFWNPTGGDRTDVTNQMANNGALMTPPGGGYIFSKFIMNGAANWTNVADLGDGAISDEINPNNVWNVAMGDGAMSVPLLDFGDGANYSNNRVL